MKCQMFRITILAYWLIGRNLAHELYYSSTHQCDETLAVVWDPLLWLIERSVYEVLAQRPLVESSKITTIGTTRR